MNNEEKIKAWCEYDSNNMDMYELIVAGEREKMQGVEVFVSWDSEDNELEIQKNRCSVWADRPWHDREFGTFNGGEDVAWLFNVDEDFCDMLGVDSGQCKKFRIVEELP